MTEMRAIGLVLLAAFLGSFGSMFLKLGANRLSRDMGKNIRNKDLIRGLFIYGMSSITYLIGIKGGQLSILFPLISTGYIWICFLSVKYLGEKMNTMKWAGIGLIMLGVALIGLGS
jgi:uncharacterized membrane protein